MKTKAKPVKKSFNQTARGQRRKTTAHGAGLSIKTKANLEALKARRIKPVPELAFKPPTIETGKTVLRHGRQNEKLIRTHEAALRVAKLKVEREFLMKRLKGVATITMNRAKDREIEP